MSAAVKVSVQMLALVVAVGAALVSMPTATGQAPERARPDLRAAWRLVFAEPEAVRYPAGDGPTPAQIKLGARLFEDRRLSATGTVACATCHAPARAFTDGQVKAVGVSGKALPRNTPTLWNLNASKLLYWDGRARNFEDQARFPIEHPDEMGNALTAVAERLTTTDDYQSAFAVAFPADATVTPAGIVAALAAYQRTLVSPRTRFDRWIAGDGAAMSDREVAGFELFTGRARCVACHGGYAFSDYAFHDIGLPSADLGRGAIVGVDRSNHTFKTPTLRELTWTAPYMHDGSVATLNDVVQHYMDGLISRPTLSPRLKGRLELSGSDKADLVAFLKTLSSEAMPRP